MSKAYERPSLIRLFIYITLFILLSLHAPYCYMGMREDLVVLPDGSIDYDMGGIFPFTAVMIQALFFQAFATVLIFTLTCMTRLKASASSAMIVAFLSILGLQALMYSNIYFDRRTKPEIIQAWSVYPISWLFLLIFSLYSIFRILMLLRQEKACANDSATAGKAFEAEQNNSSDGQIDHKRSDIPAE
ncbi:MAG: hypothetical protein KKB51_13890 [Candidatus Riflebacteria bacterium]|nr:hypothetical protein [Candidatus Riflebacteria bacterium]